ncbi:MAG: ribose transport system permease protein [Verrucomicrobiales bacterium]|jgi:ribose transport system permease protein
MQKRAWLIRHISDYGMLIVLLILVLIFSIATIKPLMPKGASSGKRLADDIIEKVGKGAAVFVFVREDSQNKGQLIENDREFLDGLRKRLDGSGKLVGVRLGKQPDWKKAFVEHRANGTEIDAYAVPLDNLANQAVFNDIRDKIVAPRTYTGSTFLQLDSLLSIWSQVAITAIIAIGMTFVIITAGIDLSVGSLVALSAVVMVWLVREWGGIEAGLLSVLAAGTVAIALCALLGLGTGSMVTFFGMPPFIVTLGLMMIARGLAELITGGKSIREVPDGYEELANGFSFGIPNAAILLVALYVVAHLVLTKTKFGRYVYAIGGNIEAARLSGVPIRKMVLSVYVIGGALAGLGGVMLSSQLRSGSHNFGEMLELDVIAAVVVGGASLMGGEGRMIGTLIGALIIGVIRKGMNQVGLEGAPQAVVLGSLILIAVLLDQLKKQWLAKLT